MNRRHWLALTALLLLLGNVVWYVWTNWGLITIHSDDKSLAEIIRSIEKQGGVTVKTDLDLDVPLRMHVKKVKLAEALETLSALTESRWRLTYLVAPDKAGIASGLASLTAGQRMDGWKALFVPVAIPRAEPDVPPDPRADPWQVRSAKEPNLQSYLQQGSRSVSAAFVFREDWNPDVTSPPRSGPVTKVMPRLASAAHGQCEEFYFLRRNDRRAFGDDDGGLRRASFDADAEREQMMQAMEERAQAEIAKLPPAERGPAQQEFNERKKFGESLRDLTREERLARFREYMDDPNNFERFEKMKAGQDARKSPQQKLKEARRYLDFKAQAKGGGSPP